MDPERWQRLKAVCSSVLEGEPDKRHALAAELCAGDAELHRDVDAMLKHATGRGGILDGPVWEKVGSSPAGADDAESPTKWLPETIGRYRILRLVGDGGMGAVYEAQQEQPRRIVALKLMKQGLASPELLRRFEQESLALGRLQHPGIAQIYDAGTAVTAFGAQPYFAMEFIRGEELRAYVTSRRLNVPQRLELMLKICDAVHHAHQRGLIHRDLKPGNILVDDTGQTKVLDFGVARLTDIDPYVSRFTDAGQLVGTLAYMSPEQLLADPLGLDIRSDVYTLGVILYELLAGHLPHGAARLHEVTKAIREEDPKPLSSVSSVYRGDLETIAAKALEKDKERRYNSAAALAADIRRYLQNEPIAARPPSTSYQLRKFARRHRTLVTAIAAVFVVLVAGIVATTLEAVRARRAQQEALTAGETAQAVSEFLQNDLLAQAGASAQAGPTTRPDPDIKVRTALDRAAAAIGEKFKSQPLVEAAVRRTIARTYRDLGLYAQAQEQITPALALRRRVLGDTHSDTLESLDDLASLYWLQGKYSAAEPLFEEILTIRRRMTGDSDFETLTAMNNLGLLYLFEGKFNQAEPLLVKALEARRHLSGESHPETLVVMANLAQLYERMGKYKEAEKLFETAIELRRQVSGPEHPETLTVMNNLSTLYRSQGRYAKAEALLDTTLAIRRRVLGEEHPNTLTVLNNLGNIYVNEGRIAQAEALFTQLLAVRRRVLSEDHPNTLLTAHNLANVFRFEGRYTDAEVLVTRTIERQRQLFGDDNSDTLLMTSSLGFDYALERKYDRARELLETTLQTRTRVSGADHPEVFTIQERLAFVHQSERQYAQAEELLTKVLESRRRVLSDSHPDTLSTRCSLGFVQFEQNKFAEAEATLRDGVSNFEKFGVDTWQRHNCQALLGSSLAAQGRLDEAKPALLEGYEALLQSRATMGAPNAYYLEEARRARNQFNRDLEKGPKRFTPGSQHVATAIH